MKLPICISLIALGFALGVLCRPPLGELKRSLFWYKGASPRVAETSRSDRSFDLVLLGDSLTDHGRWSELLTLTVANRGITGDTVAMTADRAGDLPAGPIFLMVGINDLLAGRNVAQVVADYARLLDILNGRRVTIQSVVGPDGLPLPKLNDALLMLAVERGARFLDLRPELGHPLKYSYDGIHLTAEGYRIWANALIQASAR